MAVEAEALRQLTQQLLKLCETLCAAEESACGTLVHRRPRHFRGPHRPQRLEQLPAGAWAGMGCGGASPIAAATTTNSDAEPTAHAVRWGAPCLVRRLLWRPAVDGGSRSRAIERPSPLTVGASVTHGPRTPLPTSRRSFSTQATPRIVRTSKTPPATATAPTTTMGTRARHRTGAAKGGGSWRPYRQVIHGGAGLSRAALSHRASEAAAAAAAAAAAVANFCSSGGGGAMGDPSFVTPVHRRAGARRHPGARRRGIGRRRLWARAV